MVIAGLALAPVPAARAQPDPQAEGDTAQAVEPAHVPAAVERIVRSRALAFDQDEPFGGSLEVAALIDGNVNRATRADGMGAPVTDILPPELAAGGGFLPPIARGGGPPDGTPGFGGGRIADFGVSLRGQAWLRRQVDNDSDFLVRVAGSGQLYGDSRYDDLALAIEAGPELFVGSDRIALFAGPTFRWYGTDPYSRAIGGGVSWQHPLGRGLQLRVEGTAAQVDNRRDDLLDGASFSLTAELDKVLSRRSGMGAQVLVVRETARDPGYATVRAGLNLHAFRAFGTTTLVGTAGYSRLEGDRALAFLPVRRRDDRFTASLSATFAGLRLGPAAPLVRLNWERNRSSLDYYDFSRVAAEIGLVGTF